jgi:hypothetical protein
MAAEEKKEKLVQRILEIEVDMFRRVRTGEEPSCRAFMEDMKLHRRGQFSSWSGETCASYLADLERALAEGQNLMTMKYARMDNLIEPLSTNPLIHRIRDRYVAWQGEVHRDCPNTMRRGRDLQDFANYLGCELETYSDTTLHLLWYDVEAATRDGRNLAREVYESLARQSGYDTLEDMERVLG